MPTFEDLLEKRKQIGERICFLQGYLAESRRIYGSINEIIYRWNSGIDSTYEQIQRKNNLENELKEKNAQLKRCHQLTPHRVCQQIREDDFVLCMINRQLDDMEQQAMAHPRPAERPPEPEAVEPQTVEERHRLDGLENRLAETELGLLTRQAAQEVPPPEGGRQPGLREPLAEVAEQHRTRQQPERRRDDDRDR